MVFERDMVPYRFYKHKFSDNGYFYMKNRLLQRISTVTNSKMIHGPYKVYTLE